MADNTEFQDIWTKALAEYERNTGRNLKIDAKVQDISNVEDLLSAIHDSEQRFKDFRTSQPKLWTTLRHCMTPVELVASLAKDSLGSTPYAPLSILFAAMLYLVKAANGVRDSYNSIEDLLLQLQDFTDRLREYVKFQLDASLRRRLIAILSTLLQIIARSEELIKQGRLKKFVATTFRGADDTLTAAMTRLRDLSDSEQRQVAASAFSTTRKTLDVVQSTANAVERSGSAVENLAASISDYQSNQRSEKDRRLIKDILYSPALGRVLEVYGTLCDRRLSGSGLWLQDEALFQTWMKGDDALLWIFGNPGAGKSYLSSQIVSFLEECYPQDPIHPSRVSVAYWFIKEDEQDLRSLPIILKGLAYQIAERDPIYAKYVANVCATPSKISSSLSTWKKLFLEFFQSAQCIGHRSMIVIDGLDEASRDCRDTFLEMLRRLESDFIPQSSSSIQFVIAGRPEIRDDILSVWEKHTACIDVSPSKNTPDIMRYVQSEIRRVSILRSRHLPKKAKQDLHAEIVRKIVHGANGMFLWVNLMIDQISRKSRPSEIRAALDDAPRDLLQMIRHVFERLSSNPDVGADDLNEILSWVTYVRRPLSLSELDIILRLRSAEQEPVTDLEERLRGLFASFFTLIRSDGKTTEDLVREMANDDRANAAMPSDLHLENTYLSCDPEYDELKARGFDSDFGSTTVRFTHASIRDYLLQEGAPATRRYSEDLIVGIDTARSEAHVLKTCLTVLVGKDHVERPGLRRLREYAASNVLKHLYTIDPSQVHFDDKIVILKAFCDIFNEQDYLKIWVNSAGDPRDVFLRLPLEQVQLTDRLKQWFGDEVNSSPSFNVRQRTYMQRAASSSTELFAPLSHFWAKLWLEPTLQEQVNSHMGAIAITTIWFLHLYDIKFCNEASTSNLHDLHFDDIDWNKVEKDRIISLASLFDFPQTSLWHRRVGGMLSFFDHEALAITYMEKALELDSSDWSNKASLAICYRSRSKTPRDKDGLYGYALLREAFQESPIDDPRRARVQGFISTLATILGDYETAANMSREALNMNPEDRAAMLSYLFSLFSNKAFQTTADWLKDLSTTTSSQTGETVLMDFLLNCSMNFKLYSLIGIMLREVDEVDWANDKFRQALGVAERAQNSRTLGRVRLSIANFLLEQTDDREEALVLLEESLESATDFELRNSISDSLSSMYFENAYKAHKARTNYDVWIQKLNNLAVQKNTVNEQSDTTTYGINDASIMLGKWYRLNDDAIRAKACFKPTMLQGLDILTDDDPDNDMDGYVKLAKTLLHAGDQQNASTAFAVCIAPLDRLKAERGGSAWPSVVVPVPNEPNTTGTDHENDIAVENCVVSKSTTISDVTSGSITFPVDGSNEEAIPDDALVSPQAKNNDATSSDSNLIETNDSTKHEISTEDSSPAGLPFDCEGDCNPTISRRVEDFRAYYRCEICRDIDLCDMCLGLLKEARLTRICSPDHTFYQCYPLPANLEEVGVVNVGGKILPKSGWLKQLREEWAD